MFIKITKFLNNSIICILVFYSYFLFGQSPQQKYSIDPKRKYHLPDWEKIHKHDEKINPELKAKKIQAEQKAEERKKYDKEHKKAVKEHLKRIGNETDMATKEKVYKRIKKRKKESKRVNKNKPRHWWVRKNPSPNKEPFLQRIFKKNIQ